VGNRDGGAERGRKEHGPLLAADAAHITQEHGTGSGAITQNGDPPYATDHVRVVAHLIKDTPLQLSNLRAPGKIANGVSRWKDSPTSSLPRRRGPD